MACEIAKKRSEEQQCSPDPLADQLIQACRDGSIDMARYLLGKNASINVCRCTGTPLGEAITSNNAEALVGFLLEAGADPNLLDQHGCCPLFITTSIDQAACTKLLLSKGAYKDLAHLENGWTPLMNAAAEGSAYSMVELLSSGADVNLKSKDGLTAMDLAKANGKFITARVLARYLELVNKI